MNKILEYFFGTILFVFTLIICFYVVEFLFRHFDDAIILNTFVGSSFLGVIFRLANVVLK